VNREHDEFGWYAKGEPKFLELFKCESMQVFGDPAVIRDRSGLYQLKWFFDVAKVSPDEFLKLPEDVKRQKISVACRSKQSGSAAQVMFYTVLRFLDLNGKSLSYTRQQKRSMFKKAPYKNGKQHIPKAEEVYRMIDSFPKRNRSQQLRGKALILCQWQSGVRSTCLCDWRYGMFHDKLNPDTAPLLIKIVSKRQKNDWTVAVDTKLSGYGIGYYYTFLGKEAISALRDYLEERKRNGWQPHDEDQVFVTEGTVQHAKGQPVTARHLLSNVKTAAHQIGLDPSTVWAHLLRKSFRNVLRRAGLEEDVCEALMGHTLPNSQGSYFDTADMEQARDEYESAEPYFSQVDHKKVEQLEEEIPKRDMEIQSLKNQIEKMQGQIDMMLQGLVEKDKQYFELRHPRLKAMDKTGQK
jgi:site-specific recombinase XerD